VDLLVSDAMWRTLFPDKGEAGLICGACIMDRMEYQGEYGAFQLVEAAQHSTTPPAVPPKTAAGVA